MNCNKLCEREFCSIYGCLHAKEIQEINWIKASEERNKLLYHLSNPKVLDVLRKLNSDLIKDEKSEEIMLEKIKQFDLNPFNGKTGKYKYGKN